MHAFRGLPVATVTCVVAVGGVVAWAPWSAGRPGEGGTGHAVVAPSSQSVPASPPPTASPVRRANPRPAGTVTGPATGWIATLHSPLAYASSVGGPVVGTLAAKDPFGSDNVVAVIGRPTADGWAHVELPVRPDGTTGWIRTAAATLSWTDYRVTVSVSTRTLTVTKGASTVLRAPVAVGAPRTPTPTGSTYVWELIRPDAPTGAYGPYIFGLATYSDAIAVFNGGAAQIGIHGQDEPWSIGRPVSHGCVRVDNALITDLAGILPLGTPVTIS